MIKLLIRKIFSTLLITLMVVVFGLAQDEKPVTIQPTIMAIPFTPEGRSLRRHFEQNQILRVAIIKVNEVFDERWINTIDFRAKLKQLNNTDSLTDEQQRSINDDVIALSGADIYVEVEAKKITQIPATV